MKPIWLHLSKPDAPRTPGGSRFWGNPDLPSECEYPSYIDDDGDEFPYFFICQINLAEVAPYDVDHLLPHEGMLSFFAKIDHYLGYYAATECVGGTISDPEAVKVLYFPSCEGLEEVVLLDAEDKPTAPGEWRIDFGPDLGESSDEHALFAPPDHRPWEHWDPPFEEWRILLQVDSFEGDDFGLNLMDVGVLDFLIDPAALAERRFDQVRAIVLSS